MTRLLRYALSLMAIIILLILPSIISDAYLLHIVITVGIAVILATSARLTMLPGIWNVSIIAFYGIGAYAVFLLMENLHLSFWIALIIAGASSGIIALLLGYFTISIKGLYFALLSIAFIEVTRLTIIEIPFLGGYKAVKVPPIDPIVIPHLFTIEFVSKVPFYYLMLLLVAITLFVLYRIDKSRIGAVLESIADSEPLAESIGINATRYKVLAFIIGSIFAALAGGFHAVYSHVISPQSINLWAAMVVFIAVIIGGQGSIWGPVIGASLLAVLPEVFRGAVYWEPLLYALVVIFVVFFLPEGLITLPRLVQECLLKLSSANKSPLRRIVWRRGKGN